MKIFVFFDGSGCVSKPLIEQGHDVRTLDILPLPHIDYAMDILDFTPAVANGWIPDKLWFSPPCETYSCITNMKGGGNLYYQTLKEKKRVVAIYPREDFTIDKRLLKRDPVKISAKSKLHREYLIKCLEIIEYYEIINPDLIWFIENPASGYISHLLKLIVAPLYNNRTTYCMYGSEYRKETSIFSNIKLDLRYCRKHRKNIVDDCGGHKDNLVQRYDDKRQPKGVVKSSTYLERSSIPKDLVTDIFDQIHQTKKHFS